MLESEITLILIVIELIAILALSVIVIRSRKDKAEKMFQEMTEKIRQNMNTEFSENRRESGENFAIQTKLLNDSFTGYMKFLQDFQQKIIQSQSNQNDKMVSKLDAQTQRSSDDFDNLVKSIQLENKEFRHEQTDIQKKFQEELNRQMELNREKVDNRLKDIQTDNNEKLEAMKKTVDEKLQESVEKHFNDSFKLISDRLEQVHKGLGEMQTLASGVGDLKKVLTNVKTRGNIGEIQLSAILEQYLAPDQYLTNTATVPGSTEIVEFAVKMPGKMNDEPVLLPIDSKFPVEDYNRLIDCYEQFPRMSQEVKKAQESFARTVKKCAGDIRDKYLYPPKTTPFGMMFVPSEGIYAEILRIPGLFEQMQNEYKIAVVGPSNLVAFLNSLQLGFKTLAIEKRSNEVWQILGAVKTEFRKFGDVMESTKKSLQTVCNHMDQIGTRSRAMERKLKDVQEISSEKSASLLSDNSEEDR